MVKTELYSKRCSYLLYTGAILLASLSIGFYGCETKTEVLYPSASYRLMKGLSGDYSYYTVFDGSDGRRVAFYSNGKKLIYLLDTVKKEFYEYLDLKEYGVKESFYNILQFNDTSFMFASANDTIISSIHLRTREKLYWKLPNYKDSTVIPSYNSSSKSRLMGNTFFYSVFWYKKDTFCDYTKPIVMQNNIYRDSVSSRLLNIFLPERDRVHNYQEYNILFKAINDSSIIYGFSHIDTLYYWQNDKVVKKYVIPSKYSVDIPPYEYKVFQDEWITEYKKRIIEDPNLSDIFVTDEYLVAEVKSRIKRLREDGYYHTYRDAPTHYLVFDINSTKYLKSFDLDSNHSFFFNIDNIFYGVNHVENLSQSEEKILYKYDLNEVL